MMEGGWRGGWWDVHASAWRRARALFAAAATVVAVYVVGLGAFLIAVGVTVVDGSSDRLADWTDGLGVLPVTVLFVAAVAVAGLLVAAVGWRGAPKITLGFCRGRAPREGEVDWVREVAAASALGYGMRSPRLWVIDDPAPNALAFGRRSAGNVCFTTGALGLASEELEALTCYHVAALASRVFAYATASADLILLAEWCTRLLWASSAFVILSLFVGVPIEIAAAYVVGIGALVIVTRPILLISDRSLVALLDETDEIVDLETMRHTNLPKPFARLLLAMLQDKRRAASRWEVVHLWFERDLLEVAGRRPRVYRALAEFGAGDLTVPVFVERCASSGTAGILARAQVAVQQANDDELTRRWMDLQKSFERRSHRDHTG